MNAVRPAAPIRRILLALDTVSQSLASLEAATTFAARLDAELQALFVEDINLLHAAALPFAREMRLTSATKRLLQDQDMERALRAEAARAQAALAAAATRLNVRWSFRVARGQVAAQVCAAAMETDLVALTFTGGAPARLTQIAATIETVMHAAPCPLLMLPAGARIRPPFVAVYDGSPASVRALRLAGLLAETEGKRVTVLLTATEPPVARRLRTEADALFAEANVVPHYVALQHPDAAAIRRAVRAASAGTLVMAAESPLFNGEIRRRLLEDLEIAALLTR